jgi:ABC-type enterochelin transport system substrate-binding protein
MQKSLTVLLAFAVFLMAFTAHPALAQDATRTGDIAKITAESKSFTIKTARGETTVVTTDATVIKEGDKTLKFADLKVGDTIKVTGVRKDADVEAKEIVRTPK